MTEEKKEATEFSNEHIKVAVSRYPGCLVSFDVHVFPQAAKAAYQKSIKNINKEVSLPGFRKAKAPDAMIVQNYKSHVDKEWKDVLVQTAFQEAVTLTAIYPLNQQSVSRPQVNKAHVDEGAEIVIEFESAPAVPLIAPEELALNKVEKKAVSEEDFAESLENVRLHHATWTEITDRPLQEGDYVELDIVDADNPEKTICKDTRFEVSPGKIGEWLLKLIIGKNAGDTVTGTSERSLDSDPEKDFHATRCEVTIKAIKRAELPPLDEEFAKKIGASSVEDLKEKIAANLNKQAEQEVQQKLRDQLEELIFRNYAFDVPLSLVSREKKNRLDFLAREMEKAKKSPEEIRSQLEALDPQVEQEVKQAFQLYFIAREIADKQNIQITRDELVKELMQQMFMPSSPLNFSLDAEEARSKVYVQLLTEKVQDYLISKARIQ